MCYLVRNHQARAEEGGSAQVPPSLGRVRPRWTGAVAAALIGGFALAAIVAPSSTSSPTLRDRQASAPAPIESSAAAAVPMAARVETGAPPVDDGVPNNSDVAKAGMGQCHHGL
jgi:hypothetical protein